MTGPPRIDGRALAVRLHEIRGAAVVCRAEASHPAPAGRVKIGLEKVAAAPEHVIWTVDELLHQIEQPAARALEHAER